MQEPDLSATGRPPGSEAVRRTTGRITLDAAVGGLGTNSTQSKPGSTAGVGPAHRADATAPGLASSGRAYKVDGLTKVVFFRSLSALQGAGIPLVSCFSSLAQTVDGDLGTVSAEIARSLARGHTISASFARFPTVFSNFHVHLIKVGEQTGTLNRVLAYVAEFEEARERLVGRVRSALVYPGIVAGLALLGLITFPPLVLEGIFEVIRQSGVEPPLLTKAVMATSSALGSPWAWVGLPVAVALSYRPLKRQLGQARWRPYLLSIPGLGQVLRCASSARFAAALALCLRSGLNIQSSLTLSAQATDDPLLIELMPEARKAIEEGATIAAGLAQIGYFTPLFLEMVTSGEEVGRTDQMLRWLANALEKDLEQELSVFASLLEPLMLLAVGIVVGVLVIATATPMLSLVQSLG